MTGQLTYMAAQARHAEHMLPRRVHDEPRDPRSETRQSRPAAVRVWIRRHALAS
ncbi:MAG TPA: hypothetical protein VFQ22_14190 [Longimicrobiales bacterium]|nr:hypothetical protein [Longimicrobiales bacterium]